MLPKKQSAAKAGQTENRDSGDLEKLNYEKQIETFSQASKVAVLRYESARVSAEIVFGLLPEAF